MLLSGSSDLLLRAAFSPAHPIARRDVPLAQARAFGFAKLLFKGVAQVALYCAQEGHLATPIPCEAWKRSVEPGAPGPLLQEALAA